MARSWLVALVMLTQTSCLLGEAPEYQSRRQTPPVILSETAEPALGSVVHARTTETLPFTVTFRSEDAGEKVQFILFRNYQTKRTYLASNYAQPSSNLYSDEGDPTTALVNWTFNDDDLGCNSYTLLLAHSSSLNVVDVVEGREGDVASVTWWGSVVNQNGEPADVSVDDCGKVQ